MLSHFISLPELFKPFNIILYEYAGSWNFTAFSAIFQILDMILQGRCDAETESISAILADASFEPGDDHWLRCFVFV
jgi:hypothetical protein